MEILNRLENLIGKKCKHNISDDCSIWDDSNTFECIVNGFEYQIEDSFPCGQLSIMVSITPTNMSLFDIDDIDDMAQGVDIDTILFFDYNN